MNGMEATPALEMPEGVKKVAITAQVGCIDFWGATKTVCCACLVGGMRQALLCRGARQW